MCKSLKLWLFLGLVVLISAVSSVDSANSHRVRREFDDEYFGPQEDIGYGHGGGGGRGRGGGYRGRRGDSGGHGHCEESRCGSNVRHCPHGCVFNSFLCHGGASYDQCCC